MIEFTVMLQAEQSDGTGMNWFLAKEFAWPCLPERGHELHISDWQQANVDAVWHRMKKGQRRIEVISRCHIQVLCGAIIDDPRGWKIYDTPSMANFKHDEPEVRKRINSLCRANGISNMDNHIFQFITDAE